MESLFHKKALQGVFDFNLMILRVDLTMCLLVRDIEIFSNFFLNVHWIVSLEHGKYFILFFFFF